ncbi:lysyl oxidase family protein [Fibrella aquatica]|uniref:lysyl oxidase family protein n=1 Tax=Fibrella aquatica TaxID=3242487 RepID=UPI00352256D9
MLIRVIYGVACLLIAHLSSGQVKQFAAQGGRLDDFAGQVRADSFPIQVKGLPARIDQSFGLSSVCISVYHQRVSDLKIELISPAGVSIWLTNRNGGDDGQHYTNTCFRSNGFSGYIHQAKLPFDGEYIPDGRFSFLNNGSDPNGTWYLVITDLRAGIQGSVNFVNMTFSADPMPNNEHNPCSFEEPDGCRCVTTKGKNCDLLPDLIILPRFTQTQIREYAKDDPNYPGQLRFAASIGNIGDGPLETWGKREWICQGKRVDSTLRCPDGSFARQRIYQRVYQKSDTGLVWTDREAGTNYYDDQPGHNHFHVDDWVEFRLVKLTPRKGKTPLRKLIAKGRKVSYCLFDSGICNNSDSLCSWNGMVYGEKNLPNYGLGSYSECKARKQGISVGGYDTYGVMYEGQYIQLPKQLPKGTYQLEIEVDPLGYISERNRRNNTFTMPVFLSKQ